MAGAGGRLPRAHAPWVPFKPEGGIMGVPSCQQHLARLLAPALSSPTISGLGFRV